MAEADPEVLATTPEDDDEPFVEFDISVAPSDPTLELLAKQITRDDIIIPFYQRKFVWKLEQASKLIESFLMGLPVPQVFLFENDEGQLEVIDGQQRLMSVKYFFEGYFGEPDTKGRRQVFRLKGLAERSEYNNLTYDDLPPRAARKLRNSTLRAINIKQLHPEDSSDSVFHIFERLNTGGTQLKPQEIRNAVYRGDIVSYITNLNKSEHWQAILGLTRPDKNQSDVELVLRLMSLYGRWSKYEKPMISYLNQFMQNNRTLNEFDTEDFKDRFLAACEIVQRSISKPFRPKGIINSAVLEAVMVTLLEHPDLDESSLQERYQRLIDDDGFKEKYSGRTTNTAVLIERLTLAKQILLNAQPYNH